MKLPPEIQNVIDMIGPCFTHDPTLVAMGKVLTSTIEHITNPYKDVRSDDTPTYGDVIFCKRAMNLYKHLGIYIGKGKVIHYAPLDSTGIGGDPIIHISSLKEFSEGDQVYEINFPEKDNGNSIFRVMQKDAKYKLYSPRQTVARARSLLGCRGVNDKDYDIMFNNCEHFAIWCKTNIAESKQINKFIEASFYSAFG